MFLAYHYLIQYNCSISVSMFINTTMAIYIESIPNRNSRPAILLRYAKRNGKRIERKTLANLSKTPAFIVDAIRILLKGGVIVNSLDQAFTARCRTDMSRLSSLWLRRSDCRAFCTEPVRVSATWHWPPSSPASSRQPPNSPLPERFRRQPPTAPWALYSSLIPCTAMKCSMSNVI